LFDYLIFLAKVLSICSNFLESSGYVDYMFAHYANNRRGAMLVYKKTQEHNSELKSGIVNYSTLSRAYNKFDINKFEEYLLERIKHKSLAWRSEHEFRFIHLDTSYQKGMTRSEKQCGLELHSVFITSMVDLDRLNKLLSKRKIKVNKLTISNIYKPYELQISKELGIYFDEYMDRCAKESNERL
jgi:hypothetical protein